MPSNAGITNDSEQTFQIRNKQQRNGMYVTIIWDQQLSVAFLFECLCSKCHVCAGIQRPKEGVETHLPPS